MCVGTSFRTVIEQRNYEIIKNNMEIVGVGNDADAQLEWAEAVFGTCHGNIIGKLAYLTSSRDFAARVHSFDADLLGKGFVKSHKA